jgi:hypothetical protein
MRLNRIKIDNLVGIETGNAFENHKKMAGSSYGGVVMEGSGKRKTREGEYATSAMMKLPTNTNLPKGVISTLDSNRYLPIKQSGSYQTPVNVLQFYHDGGIQGSGQGERDIMKVEGGSKNVTSNLAGRMSELSGFGRPSMEKLLHRLKGRLFGSAWYDDLWDGVKSVIDIVPKAIDGFNTVKGFLGKGGEKELDDDEIDDLVDAGEDEYKGSGVFSTMLGMLGLGRHRKMGGDDYTGGDALAEELSRATGYGKGDMKKLLLHLRRKLKGGRVVGSAWYDSLWSGIKSGYNTVKDFLPKALGVYDDSKDALKKASEHFKTAQDFLQPKKKTEEKEEKKSNRDELYKKYGITNPKGGKINVRNMMNGAMKLVNALPKGLTDKLKSKLGEMTGDIGSELAEALIGDGRKSLNDNQLNALAEMGKIDYQGSGVFSTMLGMLGLGQVEGSGVLSSMLGMLGLGREELGVEGSGVLSSMLGMLGLGKPDGDSSEESSSDEERVGGRQLDLSSKAGFFKKGGYSMNMPKPLPVVAPIIDLRGNVRLPQDLESKFSPVGEEVIGGKRCCFNSKTCNGTEHYRNPPRKTSKKPRVAKKGKGDTETTMPAQIGGGGQMSKAKLRGLAVKKIMKEEGVKLGEASKILSARIRKNGAGWFDDFTDGLKSVVGAVAPVLPFIL